jgi:hypothetical protein
MLIDRAILEGRDHAPLPCDFVVRRRMPSQAHRHALNGGPGGDRLDHFAASLARDIAGETRHGAAEPSAKRLVNRRATYAGVGSKLGFIETDFGAATASVAGNGTLQGRNGFFPEVWFARAWRKTELFL